MNQEDLKEVRTYLTEDIQHDLAGYYADKEKGPHLYHADLVEIFETVLQERDELLPVNCRWEYNIYARGKQKLLYELAGKECWG